METISIEMPLVKRCDAEKCGFNKNNGCHAKAITIGDYTNPDFECFAESITVGLIEGKINGGVKNLV